MAKSQKLTFGFLILSMVLISRAANSQGLFSPKNVVNQYTTVGFGAGSAHYIGDLALPSHFYRSLYKNVRFNLNANYTKYLTPNAAIRVQLSWVRLLGDDYSYGVDNLDLFYQSFIRNLHFRNDVKEVALSGIFNLIPNIGKGGARYRSKFTPYATIGIGLIAHDPKAILPVGSSTTGSKWQSLRQYNTSGQAIPNSGIKSYSLVQAVIPLGLGIRMKVTNKIDITFEGNLRITNTDYLDDVGPANYANLDQLESYGGNMSKLLSYRAGEAISSRTEINRLEQILQIYGDPSKLGAPQGPDPLKTLESFYGPEGSISKQRGSKGRLKDMYGTTQITISYIISDKIKCPVLK
ncbi:hypothetical protein [uncultured Arcticibacterium sp.]|uniref:hypothetical protein n=1 Tax=uncultured Arcticibacterium sp. TaxID=2173042 RepID=UPI0030F6A477